MACASRSRPAAGSWCSNAAPPVSGPSSLAMRSRSARMTSWGVARSTASSPARSGVGPAGAGQREGGEEEVGDVAAAGDEVEQWRELAAELRAYLLEPGQVQGAPGGCAQRVDA